MKAIEREVGVDISYPIRHVRSLAYELFRLEGPSMAEEEVGTMADRHAMRCIKSLVEPYTYNELRVFKLQQKTRFNNTVDLEGALGFVAQIESEPAYKLLSPKRLGNKELEVESNNMTINVIDPGSVAAQQSFLQEEDSLDIYEHVLNNVQSVLWMAGQDSRDLCC